MCVNPCKFDPLNVQYDKYNFFYNNMRSLTIPQSKYVLMNEKVTPTCHGCKVFTVVSMNITSITSNLQQFQDQILSIHDFKCDVIGFSESRLDSNIALLYNINGYSMHCRHRNRHGGGVVMYTRNP